MPNLTTVDQDVETVTTEDGLRMKPTPRAHRPEDAAKIVGVSRAFIYKLIASGELESFKLGRCRRISDSAIERLIAKREAATR